MAAVGSYLGLQPLQATLGLGFSEGCEPGDPICRWRGHDLILDIVPLNPDVLGFSNRWYEPGWELAQTVPTAAGPIQILEFGHYLASKLEAYQQRGTDPRMSHDLEDVILALAARQSLSDDLGRFTEKVAEFLRIVLGTVFTGPHHRDILPAYLLAEMSGAAKRVQSFLVDLQS